MTKEKFLEELAVLKDENFTEKMIAEIKNLKLPVVIFGAGIYAKRIVDMLVAHDVDISGCMVDSEYFKPNQTYLGFPIYSPEQISDKCGQYIFVRGIAISPKNDFAEKIRRIMNNDNVAVYEFLADKSEAITYDYILENQDKFWETYNLLADDLSRKTMEVFFKTHITENTVYIKNLLDETGVSKEYFNEFTRDRAVNGVYVDCGAYIGDSVEDFVDFVDGKYKKVFAIEPDTKNFLKLEKLVRDKDYKNVELFNCGVWDKRDSLTFESTGSLGSVISESGDITIEVDSIDNIVGTESVDFIKMDVEGVELKALQGAEKTMSRSKPVLALSAYHKKDDLIAIPPFVKSIYKNCKFYLRKHERLDLWDFDLYVIPE